MIGHARSKPYAYQTLRTQGFAEDQIPGWFMRPEEYERRKKAAASAREKEAPPRQPAQNADLALPAPRETPETVEEAPETAENADGVEVPIRDLPPIEGGPEGNITPGLNGSGEDPAPLALSQQDTAFLRGLGVVQQADGRWVRSMPDGGSARVRPWRLRPRR